VTSVAICRIDNARCSSSLKRLRLANRGTASLTCVNIHSSSAYKNDLRTCVKKNGEGPIEMSASFEQNAIIVVLLTCKKRPLEA
jgi:hypothetical protein